MKRLARECNLDLNSGTGFALLQPANNAVQLNRGNADELGNSFLQRCPFWLWSHDVHQQPL